VGFTEQRLRPSAHAPALQRLPEIELYAVCTAHADTAQAAAEKYGVTRAYGDIKAMGADPGVEAALVAVRVPAHYVLTKAAIEAGKHVYCEWPLGADTKEAEELAALARKIKTMVAAGAHRRRYVCELPGWLCWVLFVNEPMGSGVLTRTGSPGSAT
jgi:predicted dehydrogenase